MLRLKTSGKVHTPMALFRPCFYVMTDKDAISSIRTLVSR